MQKVSETVRALVDRYEKITLTAYLDGKRVDAGVGACELTTACGDDESFTFGNACSSRIDLTLAASLPGIDGQKLKVTWAVDETEHPLFDGRVEKPLIRAGHTTIEAWDAMYYGGSDVFVPIWSMDQDVDAAEAFSGIASAMGISVSDEAVELLSGIIIPGGPGQMPEDTSNSAAAGYIAGLIGGNAMIDRAGQLTVRKILQTDFETQPYAGGASAQSKDFFITGITLQREEVVTVKNEDGTSSEEDRVTEYGAGDGTLMVSNPLADQAAADRAFAALEGIHFRPGSYTFPGGLLLEPGDLITVHSMDGSYTVVCVMLSMSFDGGVKTSVSSGGAAPQGGAQGAINQALATLYADFARLRTLVAENAQITSARIANLSVDDIVAGRIRSTDFLASELDEVYPSKNTFPSDRLWLNNGEEIIRGIEIDFTTGVIRGVFFNSVTDDLNNRLEVLENQELAAGTTFTPSVSEDGVISWTNDGGKQNPDPVDITGPLGPRGISVTAVNLQFYLSTSSSSMTGGSWVSSMPAVTATTYLWQRNEVVFSDGSKQYTAAYCISLVALSSISTTLTALTDKVAKLEASLVYPKSAK